MKEQLKKTIALSSHFVGNNEQINEQNPTALFSDIVRDNTDKS